MGKLFKAYLSGSKVWSCLHCQAHLLYHDDIMSRNFQGKHGRAYLIRNVINVGIGETEERTLLTGMHSVADIHCNVCETVLGWKYLEAVDDAQKYKVNKFLVEKAKISKDKSWT